MPSTLRYRGAVGGGGTLRSNAGWGTTLAMQEGDLLAESESLFVGGSETLLRTASFQRSSGSFRGARPLPSTLPQIALARNLQERLTQGDFPQPRNIQEERGRIPEDAGKERAKRVACEVAGWRWGFWVGGGLCCLRGQTKPQRHKRRGMR